MQRQKLEEGTRLLNTSAVFLSAGRSTPRGSIPEEVLSENSAEVAGTPAETNGATVDAATNSTDDARLHLHA